MSEAEADGNFESMEQQYSVRKGYDYEERYQREREQRLLPRLYSRTQRICTQYKFACKDNTFMRKSSFMNNASIIHMYIKAAHARAYVCILHTSTRNLYKDCNLPF